MGRKRHSEGTLIRTFQDVLTHPERLARWELAFGFPFAGVDHSQSLSLHLSKRGGEMVEALMEHIPVPYEPTDRNWAFRCQGRSIRFTGRRLHLGIHASGYDPPARDGGVQDAMLASVHGCILRSVSQVVTDRYTDTHFEEPPPRVRKGDQGREFLHTLVTYRSRIRLEVTSYFTEDVSNPELKLVLVGPVQTVLGARVGRPSRVHPIPEGTYRCHVEAHVYTFPQYRSSMSKWAHECLWTSDVQNVQVDAGQQMVVRDRVPEARRVLTAGEQAVFQGQGMPAEPRVNVKFDVATDGGA